MARGAIRAGRRDHRRPAVAFGVGLVLLSSGVCGAKDLPDARARVVTHAPTHGAHPRIALTFDDGPDSRYTPEILDILAQNGARATFFVLGCLARRNPGVLQRVVAEGHEVGNHTWGHPVLPGKSAERVWRELSRTGVVIRDATGRDARWFRPPYGALDGRVRRVARSAGYDIAMWSVDPRDWRRPGSSAVFDRTSKRARDGAIILLHDGGGTREGTIEATRRLVPALRERGFELVTLSELVWGQAWGVPPPVLMVRLTARGPGAVSEATPIALGAGVRVTMNGVGVHLSGGPVLATDAVVLPPPEVLTSLGVRCTTPHTRNGLALASDTPVRVEVRDERPPAQTRREASSALSGTCDQTALFEAIENRGQEVVGVLTKRELEEPPVRDESQ